MRVPEMPEASEYGDRLYASRATPPTTEGLPTRRQVYPQTLDKIKILQR